MSDVNADRDHTAHAYTLLGVLLAHAPDRSAQAVTSAWYNRIQADGAYGGTLEMTVAGALVDGLRHGNWPWTVPPVQDAISIDQPDPDLWG